MTEYITRAYNSFSFDYRASTIKKLSKEARLAQEAEYYQKIPRELSVYFPRLVSSGQEEPSKQYFLELELYPYQNLGKMLIERKLTVEQWQNIAEHLAEIMVEFSRFSSGAPLEEDMEAMYIKKTETEYQKLVDDFRPFKDLAAHKEVLINGAKYLNFPQVWPQVKKSFADKLILKNLKPSVIHGDFCFSNILAGFLPNGRTILRFVDPRGKFGQTSVYGDPAYDLAKLMHSTDVGYEYFIYDEFKVRQLSDSSFELIYNNDCKLEVNDIFTKRLYSKFDIQRIKLIEATIYIGMCARHYDSADRQMAMYLSGVRLLNELLNK